MEKKIRIQLFTEDGQLVNDRLVTQDPEFSSGPSKQHGGPLRIEFTLLNKDDVDKCKSYLDILTGSLPLPELRGRKSNELVEETTDQRENLISEAFEKSKNQDELISYLRERDFVFMMWDFLGTFEFDINIKEKHQEEYQWMIRCIKRAKNPKADKYDPMLLIGIKILDDRSEKVVVYLNGEFHKSYNVALPSKPKETFKKTEMLKFPPYMTEEERERFRLEIRQYQLNKDKVASKFFLRWFKYVENLPELVQIQGI